MDIVEGIVTDEGIATAIVRAARQKDSSLELETLLRNAEDGVVVLQGLKVKTDALIKGWIKSGVEESTVAELAAGVLVMEPQLSTGAKLALFGAVMLSATALGYSMWINKDLTMHVGRLY